MEKVLIAPAQLAGIESPFLAALRGAGFDLVFPKRRAQMVEAELLEQLSGVKAAIATFPHQDSVQV